MEVSTYFISDLHLCEESEALNECFFAFLRNFASKARRLVINGDFVNAWWGRSQVNTAFTKKLASAIEALDGVEVHFVNGNRDFMLSQDAASLHMKGQGDHLLFDEDNKRIAITHGDQFCLEDRGHQRFRMIVRTLPLHTLSKVIPASGAKGVANWLRKRSKAKAKTPKQRPASFYDLKDHAMQRYIAKQGADLLIVGHIHKPQERHLLIDSVMKRVLVLSDWTPKGAIIAGTLEDGSTELLELKDQAITLWEHRITAKAQVATSNDKGKA